MLGHRQWASITPRYTASYLFSNESLHFEDADHNQLCSKFRARTTGRHGTYNLLQVQCLNVSRSDHKDTINLNVLACRGEHLHSGSHWVEVLT